MQYGDNLILLVSLPDARIVGDCYCVALRRNGKNLEYYIMEASANNNKYIYLVNQMFMDGSMKLHNKIELPDEEKFISVIRNL